MFTHLFLVITAYSVWKDLVRQSLIWDLARQSLICWVIKTDKKKEITILTGQTHQTIKGVSITSVETFCRLARLRYAGHVARMAPTRIIWWSKCWSKKIGQTSQKFQRGLKKWSQTFWTLDRLSIRQKPPNFYWKQTWMVEEEK